MISDIDKLIDAAQLYASAYEDDDREFIQTDVMNAFYAGSELYADELARLRDENARLRADAERLDFLDGNARFKLGWRVGAAPAGNLGISTIVQLGTAVTGIREAIDAAMPKEA